MTPIEQSYREIPLTQGQVALIDAEDYERVSAHKWFAHWAPHVKGYYAGRQVRVGVRRQTMIKLHRFIMGIADPKVKVDHRDHNGLNCCKYNLRICTNPQNGQNQKRRSDNTSGYKGVTWFPETKKWRAIINIGGHPISLGLHTEKEEAARAYDRKAIELFGEFVHLNFPLSDYELEFTTRTCPE